MAQTYRIDVVMDPAPAVQSGKAIEKQLNADEQAAEDLKKALQDAVSVKDSGTNATLQGAKQAATEAKSQVRGLTEAQRQLVENIKRQEDVERQRLALTRAAAQERAAAERIVQRENAKTQQQIRDEAARSGKSIDGLRSKVLGLFAGISAAVAVRQFIVLSDAVTNVQNKLRLVTSSTEELAAAQSELFAIAERTRSSFSGTATIFSRLAVSADELGTSNAQLLQFTESLNQAIILSGASAQEAENGLIQLSQGMASGALRGDELRSVLEQLPAVADIIAKQLGVTRGELRKMGEQGAITSKVILDAFAAARVELSERFATTVPTISQAFAVLTTKATEAVGRFNETTHASELLARALLVLGDNIVPVTAAITTMIAAYGATKVAPALASLAALKTSTLALGAATAGAAVGVGLLFDKLNERAANREAAANTIREMGEDAKAISVVAMNVTETQRAINNLKREIQSTGGPTKEQTDRLQELSRQLDHFREVQSRFAKEAQAAGGLQQEQQAALKLQARLLAEITGPAKVYTQELAALNVLLQQGKISQEQFNDAVEKSRPDSAEKSPLQRQIELLSEIKKPFEDYKTLQTDLQALLDRSAISQGEFNRKLAESKPNTSKADAKADPFAAELKTLRETNEEMRIKNQNFSIQEEALLIELELRRKGKELNDEERLALGDVLLKKKLLTDEAKKQSDAEAKSNEVAEKRQRRIDGLKVELERQAELNLLLQEAIRLREQEGVVIEKSDEQIRNLRLQQLEGATDLAAGFERAFLKIEEEANNLAAVGEKVVNVFADQATDAITTFATTGKFNFREFASAVLSDITKIIIRLLVVKAIEAGVSALGGGTGGVVSAGVNAGRAGGGTVQPGQAPMPVGERGPELFVPNRTGTIVPNQGSATQAPPQVNVQVVNLQNPNLVPEAIGDGLADEVIMNVFQRNKSSAKQILAS